MASQERRRISRLAMLGFLCICGVFVVFIIASGDANKPVSALSTTYWVLLISVLLVMSVFLIGLELGLIPRCKIIQAGAFGPQWWPCLRAPFCSCPP